MRVRNHKQLLRYSPYTAALALICAQFSAYAEPNTDLLNLDLETLLTIKVGPSADASAKGLSEPFAGEQVAKGGRIGILGTEDLNLAPVSFTNYTQDFIRDHQAASVGDVLQYDPSVRVARGFGNFEQVYKVRGLPIFSDDMTYNGLYGILPRQYLAAEAVERVQVLRGSNSFFNGAAPGVSGSLGGAIDIIPKRAPKDDLALVTVGMESENQHYLATDLATRFGDGRFGIRINGVNRNGDTLINGESKALDVVTVGMDYRGTVLRLSADIGYQNQHLNANQPSITIADTLNIPRAPDANNNIAAPWTYANARDVFGTLRVEYDFTPQITGWAASGMRDGDENSRLDTSLTVLNNIGDYSASRFDVIHQDSVRTDELGLRSKFEALGISHQLTLSFNTYQNQSHNAYVIYDGFNNNIYQPSFIALPTTALFIGGDLHHPLITTMTKTSSAAIADEISLLNDDLLLTLGVRDQRIEEYNYQYDTGTETSRYDEYQPTPIATAVYKLSSRYSLYSNYLEGLLKGDTAPNINETGAVINAGEILKPYQTKQIEMGMKYDGGELGASLSLFQIRKPISGFTNTNQFELVDEQTYRGIDFLAYGQASTNVKLLGGICILDSNIDGKNVIGTPKLQANIDTEWSIPQLPALTLSGNLIYTSAQYANADNSQRVPAWHRIDLGASYQLNMWTQKTITLRATLSNATKANYWASVGGFPNAGYLTLGNPRALLVSATINL